MNVMIHQNRRCSLLSLTVLERDKCNKISTWSSHWEIKRTSCGCVFARLIISWRNSDQESFSVCCESHPVPLRSAAGNQRCVCLLLPMSVFVLLSLQEPADRMCISHNLGFTASCLMTRIVITKEVTQGALCRPVGVGVCVLYVWW